MRKLFRTLGIVVTLGLVSFATVDASPYDVYDSCYYTCSDGQTYHTYATYFDCCNSSLSRFWCPPGHSHGHPAGNAWGGTYTPLDNC